MKSRETITFLEQVVRSSNIKNQRTTAASQPKHLTLRYFGAKGDGKTDDTQAIVKALNSSFPIIYAEKTEAFYKVSTLIIVNNISKKKLIATGAKILNSDLTKATFLFQNCKNLNIEGGEYGYTEMPTKNGGNSQHVFQFESCQLVTVNKVHILNSPEMGVAITNSNNVTIRNSVIEHTFRDGTYSHYSANIKYLNNIYKEIKDDAMSFHDYGIASQKKTLLKYGYKQATNLTATNNTIENVYQGFGSIGSSNIKVIGNRIKNTVIAGIAVFNSKELYPGSTSTVTNAQILNNRIENSCSTVTINNSSYDNNGQASTGRAAIFIGSLGSNNQVNAGESKRLKNIIIKGNKIISSKANGFWGNRVDQLQFLSNTFLNCSGPVPSQSLSGDVIEIGNVTRLYCENNSVIDNRAKIMHQHAYALNNVSGEIRSWNIKGTAVSEKLLTNTPSLRFAQKKKP
ncbi:right-handed parallel beta-helix repeat-containing protein [Spirosoma oryzicola]|uniref:right-handed parallel beta-helix repeat-containing protein n=1 Tax=Spirosoma oryzicola TaxID=2898794 RepID=UPI001E2B38FD|nr:right-handed parallel beta-helix repeat-containing protein [Spirosoma oryzicola]UHG91719.1 right-handed parallel beta-helix repeat-containing protein [Spirosoma oryzicola]